MKNQGELLSYFKNREDGTEYLKIQNRFVYYIELTKRVLISEVADIENKLQPLIDDYKINRRHYNFQKIYAPEDPGIIKEIDDIKSGIRGTEFWGGGMGMLDDAEVGVLLNESFSEPLLRKPLTIDDFIADLKELKESINAEFSERKPTFREPLTLSELLAELEDGPFDGLSDDEISALLD